MNRCLAIIVLCATLVPQAFPQESRPTSVSLFGTFTTSSKLFRNPDAADELVRDQFVPLNSIVSGGIDIRRMIEAIRLEFGLSVEYLAREDGSTVIPQGSTEPVPVTDGFRVVPVELSGYFPIPVGNETFRILMGGGGGMYIGTRRYSVAGAEAATVERSTGWGIHIVSSLEISLSPVLLLRTDVKFRDIQFETVSAFTAPSTIYAGRVVTLDAGAFPSRVNIDGMTLNVGLGFRF